MLNIFVGSDIMALHKQLVWNALLELVYRQYKSGDRLDGYTANTMSGVSFIWLQLLLWVKFGYTVTVLTMPDIRLHGYSFMSGIRLDYYTYY